MGLKDFKISEYIKESTTKKKMKKEYIEKKV